MKETEHHFPVGIKEVALDGDSLTVEQVIAVARNPKVKVRLARSCLSKMRASRKWVEQVARTGDPIVYGINTAFGSKSSEFVKPQDTENLQRSLIVSHSCGVGEPFDEEIVRAAMLLRANTLAKGISGIRVELVENLLLMLNRGVHPVIPSQGSVGASGDLCPLSHLALVLSRGDFDKEEESGEAIYRGKRMSGKRAMRLAGIERIHLVAKEGLALNNGCQFSTAITCLAVYDAENLLKTANVAAAMTLEALRGCSDAFDERIQEARPYPGQIATAKAIRSLVKGSELIDSKPGKVQDAYSLRCVPQVHGAVHDALSYVRRTLDVEMNSATDNPLIFSDVKRPNKAFSGGNFHGEYIALAADFLAIAVAEIGSIAERRIFRLTSRFLNENLPPLLSENNTFNSGFMIPQYTAAALVSENKTLAHPASVDSIPTSEDTEDHVSMAPIAARKANTIVRNVESVVAIELLCAAQAIDFRKEGTEMRDGARCRDADRLEPGPATKGVHNRLREAVPKLAEDRVMYRDIQLATALVRTGAFLDDAGRHRT